MKRILNLNWHWRVYLYGIVVVLAVVAISLVSYRTFHKDKIKPVSYQGIIYKQNCATSKSACTGYVLSVNNKPYNVVLPANTTVVSGTKVTVQASSLTVAPSNQISTINASSISYPAPTTTSTSPTSPTVSTNTANQTTTNGTVAGNIYLTFSCGTIPAGSTCNSKPSPFQASISINASATGKLVIKIISASDGSFSVTLPAGSYIFVPDTYNKNLITAPSQTVTVTSGGTTNITINYKGLTA